MKKLEQFIDDNFNYFSDFGKSEVEHCPVSDFDDDVIDYLDKNYRFDYKGICVYLVKEDNEVWVENMA